MQLPSGLFLLLTFFLFQASPGPVTTTPGTRGIRMTVQFATDQSANDQRLYIEADRSRMEYRNNFGGMHGDGTVDTRPGPRLASITRCDLGKTYELNLEDGEYLASDYPPFRWTKQQIELRERAASQNVLKGAPTVRSETTTVDTGERKEFFGHAARHVVTTWKKVPLAGSHSEPQETVTDAWYVDLDTTTSCEVTWWSRSIGHLRQGLLAVGGERYEYVDKGTPDPGFAIERKFTSRLTITLPDGTKKETAQTFELKVTEFYEGTLDPALFEVPSSFRQVRELRRNPPLTLADRWYYTRAWVRGLTQDLFK